uniref:EamA domain-containing protein n=1 Tax=Spongospora subterranea TaxID=70186 RepID=A0A0H5R6T0_9EUKA|eukprot:CRZ09541.1 hypothetical protein [Spongospora subterranea]
MASTCATSALFSSLGSTIGKVAFSCEGCSKFAAEFICNHSSDCLKITAITYSLLLIAAMVIMNAVGISYMVKSMNIMGSTSAIAVISSIQFLLSGVYGHVLFNEQVSMLWMFGVAFIILGVCLISMSSNEVVTEKHIE